MTKLSDLYLIILSNLLNDEALVEEFGAKAFESPAILKGYVMAEAMLRCDVPQAVAQVFIAQAEERHHMKVIADRRLSA